MKGLSRQANFGDPCEVRGYDVYDIETKTKVLTCVGALEAGNFLGTTFGTVRSCAKRKSRYKSKIDGKKYAIRFAKTSNQ